MWSETQRYRLAIEKEKLESAFSSTQWIDPVGKTKVEVKMWSNSEQRYILRVCLSADFPNSCPRLQIVSPTDLRLKNGSAIPELSESFHTLERVDNFISICHFYPPDWTNDNTLYQVFIKGRIWIEAYEAHLDTGRNMDSFLGEMKFIPDPNNRWIVGDTTTTAPNTATSLPTSGRNLSHSMSTPSLQPEATPDTERPRFRPPGGGVDVMAAFRNASTIPTLRPAANTSAPPPVAQNHSR